MSQKLTTVSPAPEKPSKRASLGGLPTELRLRIFEEVFEDKSVTLKWHQYFAVDKDFHFATLCALFYRQTESVSGLAGLHSENAPKMLESLKLFHFGRGFKKPSNHELHTSGETCRQHPWGEPCEREAKLQGCCWSCLTTRRSLLYVDRRTYQEASKAYLDRTAFILDDSITFMHFVSANRARGLSAAIKKLHLRFKVLETSQAHMGWFLDTLQPETFDKAFPNLASLTIDFCPVHVMTNDIDHEVHARHADVWTSLEVVAVATVLRRLLVSHSGFRGMEVRVIGLTSLDAEDIFRYFVLYGDWLASVHNMLHVAIDEALSKKETMRLA